MKHLVLLDPGLKIPQHLITLDEINKFLLEGIEVHVAYCVGCSHFCILNNQGSKTKCHICRFFTKQSLKSIKNKVVLHPFYVDANNYISDTYQFETMYDIKKITYRSVDIGYSVLSSYISLTRELIEHFSPQQRLFFNRLLSISKALTDKAWDIYKLINPDSVSVFNGRQIDSRPFFDIAQTMNIPMRVNEIVLISPKDQNQFFKKIIYHNAFPHDVIENGKIVEKLWEMNNETKAVKITKGKLFFENKRNGKPAGDAFNPGQDFVFIKGQKKGLLPQNWNYDKKNIVIFNSSEDEYSAINRNFDSYSLFSSQYEGIRYICETLLPHPEYHVVLRVHPSLKSIPYHYHTSLYELEDQYHNLTVIKASSPCSTYDILDAAEKVITFGSTMGVEAVYWRKPVILIGPALYRNINVTYNPQTTDEFAKLLLSDLKPMDQALSLKYAYFISNRDAYCEEVKSVNTSVTSIKVFHKSLLIQKQSKVLGSSMLWGMLRQMCLSYSPAPKIELPFTLFTRLNQRNTKN